MASRFLVFSLFSGLFWPGPFFFSHFSIRDPKTVQRSALCRSRRELSNAYLLAKFGFDTAENEPCKVCPLALLDHRAGRAPKVWCDAPSSARASAWILEKSARRRAELTLAGAATLCRFSATFSQTFFQTFRNYLEGS